MKELIERLRKPGDEVFSTREKTMLADKLEMLSADAALKIRQHERAAVLKELELLADSEDRVQLAKVRTK